MLVVRMGSQIQLPVMIRIIIPKDQIAGRVPILVRINIPFNRGLCVNKFTKMQGRAIIQDQIARNEAKGWSPFVIINGGRNDKRGAIDFGL